MKCVFLGYPEGVKAYRLWRLDEVSPRIIVSRDVVFNEGVMYREIMAKGKDHFDQGQNGQIEVELTPDKEKCDVNGGSDTTEVGDSSDYNLARDRTRRRIVKPLRFRGDEENISAFVFMTAESEDVNEPISYYEVIQSKDKRLWIKPWKRRWSLS